ncbi:hypothetical protein DIPPA_24345 [Diplonema papillatum]|nr:hypothetical protein DIPPA_24345 [Diplonema papillatum]
MARGWWTPAVAAALLLACCRAPAPCAADGRVVFFGEDGIYEVGMNGAGLRTIVSLDRMSSDRELYPPAVGGLCVDRVLNVVAWTENVTPAGSIVQHRILKTAYSGGGAVEEILKRPGELWGCSIDGATGTLTFLEYYAKQGGVKAHEVGLTAPYTDPGTSGDGIKVPRHDGGGITRSGGENFMTLGYSQSDTSSVFDGDFKSFDTSQQFTGWLGYIGYIAADRSSRKAYVVDSEDPQDRGRSTNLIEVDLDDSAPHSIVWSDAPVCPHIGYAQNEMACLQPSIDTTDVPGKIVALTGSPADKIELLDLAGNGRATVYSGTAAQVGTTGIGPLCWVLSIDSPAPATDVPIIPPTPLPQSEAPETGAPNTTVPLSPIPDTLSPTTTAPATGVPKTALPTTKAPISCKATFDDCKKLADCEWIHQKGECILYGTLCPGAGEADCVATASCYWNPGPSKCEVSQDCADVFVRDDCEPLTQCTWSTDIDGCVMLNSLQEPEDSPLMALLPFILIGAGIFCLLLACITVFVCTMKKGDDREEQKKLEEEGRLLEADEEEMGAQPPPLPEDGLGGGPVPPVKDAVKDVDLAKVKEEMLYLQDVLYDPPALALAALEGDVAKDNDDDDDDDDLLSDPSDEEHTFGFGSFASARPGELSHAGHHAGGHHNQLGATTEDMPASKLTENEKTLLKQIQRAKADLDDAHHSLEDRCKQDVALRAEKRKQRRESEADVNSPGGFSGQRGASEDPRGSPNTFGGSRQRRESEADIHSHPFGQHRRESEADAHRAGSPLNGSRRRRESEADHHHSHPFSQHRRESEADHHHSHPFSQHRRESEADAHSAASPLHGTRRRRESEADHQHSHPFSQHRRESEADHHHSHPFSQHRRESEADAHSAASPLHGTRRRRESEADVHGSPNRHSGDSFPKSPEFSPRSPSDDSSSSAHQLPKAPSPAHDLRSSTSSPPRRLGSFTRPPRRNRQSWASGMDHGPLHDFTHAFHSGSPLNQTYLSQHDGLQGSPGSPHHQSTRMIEDLSCVDFAL